MNVYRVSFFGHRHLNVPQIRQIETEVERITKDLLKQKYFVIFYIGHNGEFDTAAASAVKRAQKALCTENSSLSLVLPLPSKDIGFYEKFYDDVILPAYQKPHFKAAITLRNRWMVENSDLLISYVNKDSGGAYTALKYGEKCGVNIINIAKNI